ncbi:hypothetical protein AMS68_003865 [Peltaster fructicola]|uniref:Uncharacterized protein n=1 Tax=Peltaster fructicola TaxID=286661 RepID=A0A6H0XUQ9_9PEZI|nr:hypothetical protein AMS68_003865 [Peltaster fructicola]
MNSFNTQKPRPHETRTEYHMADWPTDWTQTDDTYALVNPPKPKQSIFKKLLRHVLRFWYLYLLLIIVGTLAIILPIIYVVYPNTAQSQVDSSTIIPTHQSITKVTPTSFYYNQSALLEISTSYNPPPQLFTWNGSYYVEGSTEPFLSIVIPQIAAQNGSEIQTAQEIQITNMPEFIKNNDLIFNSDNFSIYLRGNGQLKESILSTININYDKKISLRGFNKLQDVQVTDFRILTETLSDGSNAAGNVSVANPTIFELYMGNVTFDISVNGSTIANATLPNFTLASGTNTYPLHVTSNETRVLELLKLPAYRCGVLPVTVQGKESIVDGQVIPYFTAPLQANRFTTTTNLTSALQAIGFGDLVNGTCET